MAMAAAALGAWLGFSSPAFAGDEQEVESIRLRLEQSQNQDAASRLSRMLDPGGPPCQPGPDVSPDGCRLTDPEMIKKARGYYAIALFFLGRVPDARDQIDELLRQVAREETDPNFRPSLSVFPQKVFDLIVAEQTRLADEIAKLSGEKARKDKAKRDHEAAMARAQADYVKALEAAASKETVVDKHSRWIAAIPFGVGQYQNDNVGLGLVFTLTEGAAMTSSIVSTALFVDLTRQGIESQDKTIDNKSVNRDTLNSQRKTLQIVNNVSLGTLALAGIIGIVEAEISYKPSVEHKRDRPLPKKPKVSMVGVPSSGASVGAGIKVDF